MSFKLTIEKDTADEIKDYLDGIDWQLVVLDFDNYLRAKLKYENPSELEFKAYESMRNKLYELMQDRDLILHK